MVGWLKERLFLFVVTIIIHGILGFVGDNYTDGNDSWERLVGGMVIAVWVLGFYLIIAAPGIVSMLFDKGWLPSTKIDPEGIFGFLAAEDDEG